MKDVLNPLITLSVYMYTSRLYERDTHLGKTVVDTLLWLYTCNLPPMSKYAEGFYAKLHSPKNVPCVSMRGCY